MEYHKLIIWILVTAITGLFFNACNQSPQEKLIQLDYEQNHSVTYEEAIDKYRKLDNTSDMARLLEAGETDAGKPLHLFVISKDENFDPYSIRKSGKRVLLVNNGVHPGEPCGIDASLQFANDILINKEGMGRYLDNTVICIVPVYSVGGMLDRTPYIRSNQVMPKERGRRGNGRNLDLNRDYIKQDSKNAMSLAKIFQFWQPDVFLDTHTTNGSDHQYTITLIPVQPSSFPPVLEEFLRNDMLPYLYDRMEKGEYELIPYVMYNNRNPESGIVSYLQSSRVSTGYARLFNVLGFMTENHVYKPFPDRVKSVYNFIKILTAFTSNNNEEIAEVREKAQELVKEQDLFTLNYKLDSSMYKMIEFKGYRKGMVKSGLTGLQYKGYDHSKPFRDTIPFFNHYNPAKQVKAPDYYIVPQAWRKVIRRLKINGVKMNRLDQDTSITAGVYYITEHGHLSQPYNGHFYHNNVKAELSREQLTFRKGDYVIPMNQSRNKYIVEVLEPVSNDSFFRWNFFDSCLERRDWNNPSVTFEENAIRYLKAHPELKRKFAKKRNKDPEFANDHEAQLEYIFNHSEWSKSIVGRYPVVRVSGSLKKK